MFFSGHLKQERLIGPATRGSYGGMRHLAFEKNMQQLIWYRDRGATFEESGAGPSISGRKMNWARKTWRCRRHCSVDTDEAGAVFCGAAGGTIRKLKSRRGNHLMYRMYINK
ncbi:hypothetical protein EVAR_31543_1 [Eumeta japonica]|uniref:Uncharacterized protein n=1 Tax=Eumeta variegata TaxID=151549 RepID=A0A4C1V9T7_EUMVA|nr:hypothetical protein EVAR_31543_1 [Eumeta japonica]